MVGAGAREAVGVAPAVAPIHDQGEAPMECHWVPDATRYMLGCAILTREASRLVREAHGLRVFIATGNKLTMVSSGVKLQGVAMRINPQCLCLWRPCISRAEWQEASELRLLLSVQPSKGWNNCGKHQMPGMQQLQCRLAVSRCCQSLTAFLCCLSACA